MSLPFDQIEVIKENYAPTKTGRVVTGLSARPGSQKDSYEGRLATAEDPLGVWKEYIAHTESTNPSGGPLLLQLLERATRAFVSEERYRNDPRYIELWVAYADLLPEPGDVFKYLHANHIGEDCALFFMAWAWCAEHKGNFAFADKVYARGIARKAAPVERLAGRYRQFQRRMYRKWVDSQGAPPTATASTAHSATHGSGEPKVDLEALTAAMKEATAGPGGKVLIPDVRTLAAAPRAVGGGDRAVPGPSGDENHPHASRAALGRITAHAAERSYRPTAFAEDGAYREDGADFGQQLQQHQPQQHHHQQRGAAAASGAAPYGSSTSLQQRKPAQQPAPAPVIFEDEPASSTSASSSSSASSTSTGVGATSTRGTRYHQDELGVQYSLPHLQAPASGAAAGGMGGEPATRAPLQARRVVELAPEAVRKKENEEVASKWTAPLPVRAGVLAPSAPTRGVDARIPIYVDEDKKEGFAAAAAHVDKLLASVGAAPAPATTAGAAAGAAAVHRAAQAKGATVPSSSFPPSMAAPAPAPAPPAAAVAVKSKVAAPAPPPVAAVPPSTTTTTSLAPSKGEACESGPPGGDADFVSLEESRAAAWLSAHPVQWRQFREFSESVVMVKGGQPARRSVYDKPASAKKPMAAAAAPSTTTTAPAAPAPAPPALAAPPSPVYSISFSPGGRAAAAASTTLGGGAGGGGERTVRESMLNRLFEDVDEEEEEEEEGGGKAVVEQSSKGGKEGRGGGGIISSDPFQLAGFGSGGDDVSSIQGDGTTYGNVAVTVHTGDFGGFLFGGSKGVGGMGVGRPISPLAPATLHHQHQHQHQQPVAKALVAPRPTTTTSGGISIFSDFDQDNNTVGLPTYPAAATTTTTSSHRFSPLPPQRTTATAAATTTFSNSSSSSSSSVAGLLAAAQAAGSGDVTLHTRLAMDDLDGIFSSPSSKKEAPTYHSKQQKQQQPLPSSFPTTAATTTTTTSSRPSSFPVPSTATAPTTTSFKPVAAVAPPPPPPQPIYAAPSTFPSEGEAVAVPKKTRALPPDARRLSLGFTLNRRQSGIGLPSGRLSISQAPEKRGGWWVLLLLPSPRLLPLPPHLLTSPTGVLVLVHLLPPSPPLPSMRMGEVAGGRRRRRRREAAATGTTSSSSSVSLCPPAPSPPTNPPLRHPLPPPLPFMGVWRMRGRVWMGGMPAQWTHWGMGGGGVRQEETGSMRGGGTVSAMKMLGLGLCPPPLVGGA